jgi:signal transduction histidine kinase
MEIDVLMSVPGIRWIFRGYAVAVGLAGLILFAWGPMWFAAYLPVRLAGGGMMAAACAVAALEGIESPRARRRAMLWLGIGHAALFLVVLSQRVSVWSGPAADGTLMALAIAVFAFFFLWSGTEVDNQGAQETMTFLFGPPAGPGETLEHRYERQIRAAALQEERHRLARDLHDSVKQQIFAIQTAAATAQTRFGSDEAGTRAALEQVREAARDAMAEMEAMLDQLRAAPLETVGLVESVRKQAEALRLRSGAEVDFQVGGTIVGLNLAPGAQEALFRIAQEALANVGRHARASHVTVALYGDPHFLRLVVSDNGSGFDPERAERGMGLANMRSRAAEFGGRFEVTSRPGGGTEIAAAMPVLPKYSAADYNRKIAGYGGTAVLFLLFWIFKHQWSSLFLAGLFSVYAVRVALGRSARERRQ